MKITIEEFRERVEFDGLGYTVQWYFKPDDIEDDYLREQVSIAKKALDAIDSYLELL